MTLSEWRKQHGLTQKELAARLGVTQPQIAKWERGTHSPALDSARKILEFTGQAVTLADLVRTAERP